jgi:NADPH-dependent 2,4-dienoyl-CoA reductase/sulfur reductase-like enzyme
MKRRSLLGGLIGLASLVTSSRLLAAPAVAGRVLIIGGGWGGLAAARELRTSAPQLDVTLIERQESFWSHPISNRWLVDLADASLLRHSYEAAARNNGYRFVRAEVGAIDRSRHTVSSSAGEFSYDWLIIAAGIHEDFSAWFGVDRNSIDFCRQHHASAFSDAMQHAALKQRLQRYTGGDLVMTIPPMPYRCPPAPYERAGLIAWWMKTRRIKGRLIVLDPNPAVMSFDRIFRDSYPDQITYMPQAKIKSVDPFKKQIVTDFDTVDFTDAILMPPQQAADLLWQNGLIGQNSDGKASGWATVDPVSLNIPGDDQVFIVGDAIDKVSLLFGHYPKTGQLAARLGRIAARQIAARANGNAPEKQLPESTCYVLSRAEPMELARINTSFRFRGDGLIQQTVRQTYDAQARDEDLAWASGMFGELGFKPA